MAVVRLALLLGVAALAFPAAHAAPPRTEGPSFSCAKVQPATVEALICGDAKLSRLDRALARSFQDTVAAIDVLAAVTDMRIEHRGWLASRQDCLKRAKTAQGACLADSYKDRLGRLSLWRDGTLVEEYR